MRLSRAFVVVPILAACAMGAAVSGCKKSSDVVYEPVGERCAPQTLEEGAVLRRARSGGVAGTYESMTYFSDGRVVISTRWPQSAPSPDAPDVTVRVAPERLAKLHADLERLGLFRHKQGCWETREPMPDQSGRSMVLRHRGRTFQFEGSDSTPDVVSRAERLVYELGLEVDAELRKVAPHRADGALSTQPPPSPADR